MKGRRHRCFITEREPYEEHHAHSVADRTLVGHVRPGTSAGKSGAEVGVLVTSERLPVTQNVNAPKTKIDRPEIGDVQLVHEMNPPTNPNRHWGSGNVNLDRGAWRNQHLSRAMV